MKKTLLGLTLLFPLQTVAADSVYNWGSWKDGIQPAAGPVIARAIPAAVKTPKINIRPNEAGNVNRIAEATRGAARIASEAEEAERLAAQEAARLAARLAAQDAARAAANERARLAAAEAARLAAKADEAARLAAEEAARLAADEVARLAAEEAARLAAAAAAEAREIARLAAEAEQRARLAERIAEGRRQLEIDRSSTTSITQTQPAIVSPNPAGRFN